MSEIVLPSHMSYSQVSTMLHCGEQYRLSRALHLPEAPAWALVGGSAVHQASEVYDFALLDGVVPDYDPTDPKALFAAAFDECVAKEVSKAPDEYADTATWKASGRASKAFPNKEDESFWRANGPTFVGNWINWRNNNSAEVWRDDEGKLAVELEATVEIAGMPVKVYIDRVMKSSAGLVIVDLKSGAQTPKDGLQLAVYKLAVFSEYGLDVPWGQYWNARDGQASVAHDLSQYPQERLDYVFGGVRKMQEQNIFIPHVTNMCSSCGVRRFCRAYGGELSGEVEQAW